MKKQNSPRRLALSSTTIRDLSVQQLHQAVGGGSLVYGSCNGCQERDPQG